MMKYEYVKPLELISYLKSYNWIKIDQYGEFSSIWEFKNENGDKAEILVPQNETFPDYFDRLHEALNVLEIVEQRPISFIINDIVNNRADVIRFRMVSSDVSKGTLSLAKAAAITKGIESLLLAAACATNQMKPYFAKMNVSEAKEYLYSLLSFKKLLGVIFKGVTSFVDIFSSKIKIA